MTRLAAVFERLRAEDRAGFVAYVMAGDPDMETTLSMMRGLADGGADILELGVPFTDPMADGPVIQRAAIRALAGGHDSGGRAGPYAALSRHPSRYAGDPDGLCQPVSRHGV